MQRIVMDEFHENDQLRESREFPRNVYNKMSVLQEYKLSHENELNLNEFTQSKETLGSNVSNNSRLEIKDTSKKKLDYADPSFSVLAEATSIVSSGVNLSEETTEEGGGIKQIHQKSFKTKKRPSNVDFSEGSSRFFTRLINSNSFTSSGIEMEEFEAPNSSRLNSLRSRVIHMYDRYFLRGLTAFFSKDFVKVSVFLINIIWALLWAVDSTYLTRDSNKNQWKVRKGAETLLLFEESFLWIADISLLYKILEEVSLLSRGVNGIVTVKYIITSATFVPLLEMLTTSPVLLVMKYSIGSSSVTTFFMMGFLRYFRLLNPVPILVIVFSWASEVMRICIVIIWTIACVVLGFSGAMMIIESPHPKFTSLFDYFYFTIITISTVGYGDYTPSNYVSRLICIILIIFTIIYIPNQISKLVQLAQTPPETIGVCNIGVYDESIFDREHIHTTLVLVIGSPSIKHLSYLLIELNQLNSNIDYIKQFNGKSGKIIRYQPIVMLLTNSDPREYSALVKNSQQALYTQLFVKKIKNIETLKEDIDSIKGFIHAIYFWSDAINARVAPSRNTTYGKSCNFDFQGTSNSDFTEIKVDLESSNRKVYCRDRVVDLERNTMMTWYAVRKFLNLREYEFLYRSKDIGIISKSMNPLMPRGNGRNSEMSLDEFKHSLCINSVIVFNGENADFKLDNALRDDHFYDLYGIEDINTARRNVLTNSPTLQAPKNPEEISSYLFYLSKVSNSDHQGYMKKMSSLVKNKLSFELPKRQQSLSDTLSNSIEDQKSTYTPIYIAEIRSRLLAKTALCPGFSTLLTNLFNTIKMEDLEAGESVKNSIKCIIDEYGNSVYAQLHELPGSGDPRRISKLSKEDSVYSEIDKMSTFEMDFSELEKGILNKMTTVDEGFLLNNLNLSSQVGLLTKDYIRGTHCELMEIPLPSHFKGMQFLQIAAYIFEFYSIICIGIAADVCEESNINKGDCGFIEDESAIRDVGCGLFDTIFERENDDDLYDFIITSEDEETHNDSLTEGNVISANIKQDSYVNSQGLAENNTERSEKLNFKKLKLLPNKLKLGETDGKISSESNSRGRIESTESRRKKENKLFSSSRKRRILNPSDYIVGRKWKYGDLILEEETEVSILVISNSRRKVFSLIHEKENLNAKLERYKERVIPQARQTLNYIRLCLQGKTNLINNKLIIPSWKVETPITPRIRKSDPQDGKSSQLRGLPPSPIHRETKYSKVSKIEKMDILCPSKIEGYIHGTTFILLVCEWPESLEEFLNGIILNRSIPVGWDSMRYSNRYFRTSVPITSQSLILSTIIVFLSMENNEKYLKKAIVPPGCVGIHIQGNSSNDEDLIRSGLFYAHSIVVCSSNTINSDAKVVTTCWRIHSLINMKIQAEVMLLKSKNAKPCSKFKQRSMQRKEMSGLKRSRTDLRYKEFKSFDAKWNMWQWKVTANLAQLTKKWLFEGGHLPPCFFPAIIADIRYEESLPLLDNTSWISQNDWDFSTCPTVVSGRVLTTDMIVPIIFKSVRINPLLATSDTMKPLLGYNERYNFFNNPQTFDCQVNENYSRSEIQRLYTAFSRIPIEAEQIPDYTEWGSLELISIPEQFHGKSFTTLFKEMLKISGIIIVGMVHILGNGKEVPESLINEFISNEDKFNKRHPVNSQTEPHLNRLAPKFSLNNRILLFSPDPKHIVSKFDLIYVVTPITKIF
ncbi:Potassium channel domain containing protein [Cryptosporidium felis]|nr:Potassium channel domain containing protein [Cryptosporidium felis]